MSSKASRSKSFFAQANSATDDASAAVDRMIQNIQTQIKKELGFREILVSSGNDATAEDDLDVSTGFDRSSANNSISSSYSDENVRQVVGDDAWETLNNSKRSYLYGLKAKPADSDNSDGSFCSDCARGTVYVSPKYDTKDRLLVIVPYREAGIWSRSICMHQTSGSDTSGSMISYLEKALKENYGVIILNPAAQPCHPREHVEQAWDSIVAPLSSSIFLLAFSRGCQFVQHLLNHDNGQGVVQDRVKALALVEPSHYVAESDTYFARRVLARRAVAWILSSDIDVGSKIPKGEQKHGCVCISAGAVPSSVQGSSGAWALEMVRSSVYGSFAARSGEAADVTVNEQKISSCGICHRKLTVLNRRIQCAWCQVKLCSRCCEDKFVPAFNMWRVCKLCQSLPCLIDPRTRKQKEVDAEDGERMSVFIKPNAEEPVSLKDFEIVKLIGRGACGRVKLVRKKHGSDEGAMYAMKAIRKKLVIQRGLVEATNAERRILDSINHTYVATLRYAFQTDAKLYLLSKYYPGGNLLDQMRLARRFSEDRTRLYAAEVALAIRHLHEHDIIYRDLKLENVLVGSDGHIALTDFGMSKENMDDDSRTSTFVGTYQMMAPEVFMKKSYSRAVDWWALGVMVYEMIDGRTPFNAKTNKLIRERITNVDLRFSPRFTEDAKDFVAKLLSKDEEARLGTGPRGFEHLMNHPWFGGLDWKRVEQRLETFEGQENLMKTHAKEYETNDIFDTYMNTLEVPVDTPASVKSTHDEHFKDFAFNYMDEDEENEEDKKAATAEAVKEGRQDVSELIDDHEEDQTSRTLEGPIESHFDIANLGRHENVNDPSGASSMSSDSTLPSDEAAAAALSAEAGRPHQADSTAVDKELSPVEFPSPILESMKQPKATGKGFHNAEDDDE